MGSNTGHMMNLDALGGVLNWLPQPGTRGAVVLVLVVFVVVAIEIGERTTRRKKGRHRR